MEMGNAAVGAILCQTTRFGNGRRLVVNGSIRLGLIDVERVIQNPVPITDVKNRGNPK